LPERAGTVLTPAGGELFKAAAEATAAGSKSFYFATRFFPPELARAAHGVYWFCRTTDDLVDESADPEAAARALDEWDARLRDALAGRAVEHPALQLFSRVAAEYGIPHEYPVELIEGMRMDLAMDREGLRYQDFEQLRVFCYRVASVVGLMMMHVIGYRGEPRQQAIDLGIALQLTNILRDIGEDLQRGRVYLPLDEMREFGYSEAELRGRVRNGNFVRLMQFQAARARAYYASAEPGIAMLDRRGRFAVEVAARVYAGILGRIEASGYDVFERRAVVPAARKYWITARTLALPAVRRFLPFSW
jgi:15-cis-phytoene synthase